MPKSSSSEPENMLGYIRVLLGFQIADLKIDLSRWAEGNHKGSAAINTGRGRQRNGQSKRKGQELSPPGLAWERATSQECGWPLEGGKKPKTWK